MEPVPENHMSLITEDLNVTVIEEFASQNASRRCKCKEIVAHQLIHSNQFSPSEVVSVLHHILQILPAKESHQSQKAEDCYYGISTITRFQVWSHIYSIVRLWSLNSLL